MKLIPKITLIVLLVLGLVVTLVSVMAPEIKDEPSGDGHNPMLYTTYVYSIITLSAVLVSMVYSLIKKPESILRLVINVAIFVAIMGIAYGMATGEDLASFKSDDLTESISRLSGASLYAVYWLAGIAVAAIGFSSIYKQVK